MKKLSALLLAAIMMLTALAPLSSFAEDGVYGDFVYADMGEALMIYDYTGSDTSLTVPAEINGKPVTEFYTSTPNDTVTEITISEGITSLGHSCLMDWTALTTVNLPSTLESLGQSAIIHAPNLEKITVADGNRYMTDIDGVLYCAIDTYQFDTDGNPLWDEPMVRIGYDIHAYPAGRAGASYEISTYAAGYDVIEVAERAFSDADNLETVFIPSTVDTVHYAAFEKCDALTTVEFATMEGIMLDDEYESAIFGYKYDEATGDSLPGWRDDLTIVCYEGSAAEQYASANGITVRRFGDEIPANGGASAEIDGSVPAGTMLVIADTSSHDEEIGVLAGGKRFTAYDISLLCDGSYIQPEGTVTIFLPVPEGMNGATCKVYHFSPDEGTFVDVGAMYEGGKLTFVTDHFSLFVIVDESAGGQDILTVGYDINGDGAVNAKDLTRLMKYIAGEDVTIAANDVNGDGTVSAKDLTRLMKYLAGAIEKPLPYDEAYSRLADWIKKNGTASNGTYGYSSEEYTTDYGSVYSLQFMYRESDSSISVTVFYTEGDEQAERYGLMNSTFIYLYPQTQNTDSIDYQFIYDNTSYRDMSCYIIGTQSKSKFYSQEELTYSKAEFGDWDENEMFSYLSIALTDSLYQADAFLAQNNAGMSFSDLGIVYSLLD